jgi:hypothetical protein
MCTVYEKDIVRLDQVNWPSSVLLSMGLVVIESIRTAMCWVVYAGLHLEDFVQYHLALFYRHSMSFHTHVL